MTGVVGFWETDREKLARLSTPRLERRLAIHRRWRSPLRYRMALKRVLEAR